MDKKNYSSNEFTNEPIKIHLTNIYNNQIIQTFVFVGNIHNIIKKELVKIENTYNNQKNINPKNINLKIIQKFYGKNWKNKLGIINVFGGDDNEDNKNKKDNKDKDDNKYNELDELEHKDELGELEHKDELDELLNIDIGDIGDISNISDKNQLITDEDIISAEDINNIPDMMEIIKNKQKIDFNQDHNIKFLFDINLYPIDKISELKLKIQYITDIPIYKQHLWINYNDKIIPLNYSLTINNQFEHININNINEASIEKIENIPVNTKYYNYKDFINVHAMDNMSLLHNYYEIYGITDYYLVDLSNIINEEVYKKLSSLDRYKIELIYYGFIILYFPMMSLPVFIDYIKNEKDIKDIYPDLYPSEKLLKYRFEKEANIINEMYEIYSNKKIFKELSNKLYTSITSSIVKIKSYNQENDNVINLRNLFDLLELDDYKVFCTTKLNYNNKNLILKKSYYNEIYYDETGFNSLLIHIKINPDTIENIKFIIFKNGNYSIKTEFREEAHMTFETITELLIERINPILDFIDNNSQYVKYYNKKIERIKSNNIIFTETNISYYYEKDLTENNVNLVNEIINDYVKSDILVLKDNINAKELNKNLINEFYFNKGMYKYDPHRIEKNIVINNYYEYLSSAVIKQKWNTIFNRTRNMQIFYISSKLKFNINRIQDELEMEIFSLLLLTFIKIYENNKKSYKTEIKNIQTKNPLKKLKLQDPLLYDFKKIYKSNIVYSKICQKKHQPLILSEEEYNTLNKDEKKNTVKYWNFTKEEPVWYNCPNKKYPYIKYIIKKHPKDYCIPCCKKIDISNRVNPKKQEIHNTCVKSYQYSGEKVNLTNATYYIMSYGKDIKLGHLSRLPENTLEPLLFDTYSSRGTIEPECISNEGYYLLGVQQNFPNINNIGFISILLLALKYDLDKLITDVINKINTNNIFNVLLDGEIYLYFQNTKELCNAIFDLKNNKLLHNSNIPWNDIFISLAHYIYGINTIIFRDNNKENIDLIIKKNITNIDLLFPKSHQNLVVINKGEKYYPVCLVNIEIYKRTSNIENILFLNDSGIVSIIKSIIKKEFEIKFKNKDFIDIETIDKFLKYNFNGIIKKYYVNKSNLCYGLLINYLDKDLYFPIKENNYTIGDIEIQYEYKNICNYDFNILYKFIEDYNKWTNKTHDEIYPTIKLEKWISVVNTNKVIGFISNNLHYYFNEIETNKILKILYLPISLLLYHPNNINKLIIDNLNKSSNDDSNKNMNKSMNRLIENNKNENTHELNKSLYNYYVFQLIYLGFTEYFNNSKNNTLRNKLYKIISKTKLNKNTDELREFIELVNDNEDKIKLKNISNQFIINNDKKLFIEVLENTKFNFDKKELEELKNKSLVQIKNELNKIASKFTVNGKINYNNNMNNFITLCDIKKDNMYCDGKKIIIDKNHLNNIIEIISGDIKNPIKWKWIFNPIFIDGVVNFLQFIKRPHEYIYISYE